MPLSSPPRHQPGADAWRKRRPGTEPRRCHRLGTARHGDRGHGQPGHVPFSSSWRDAGGATTTRPPRKMSFCCRELNIAPRAFGGLLLSEVFIAAGELRGHVGWSGWNHTGKGRMRPMPAGGRHRGDPAWSPKFIHRGAQPHLQKLSTHPAAQWVSSQGRYGGARSPSPVTLAQSKTKRKCPKHPKETAPARPQNSQF